MVVTRVHTSFIVRVSFYFRFLFGLIFLFAAVNGIILLVRDFAMLYL